MYADPMIYMNKDDNEVWKPLVFTGVRLGEYLISNHGNIYDMIKSTYVNPHTSNTNGYVYVSLRHTDDAKSSSFLLHRIVADNFIYSKRFDQDQVNHMSGIKTCNRETNLEWTNGKENVAHGFANNLFDKNIGENSHLSKFTNDQVEKICQLLSQGLRYKEVLVEMGMEVTDNNLDMIGNIYRGIAWTRISSKYNFPEYDQRFRANSREYIESVCECIEKGMSNREIFEFLNNRKYDRSNDKNAYEKRIEEIIANMRMQKQRAFYIAAFPFFSRKNSLVYNLLHYTNNPIGFKLFKSAAWKIFGGKSSSKDTHGIENQLTMDIFGDGDFKTEIDEDCYYIKDIADYVQSSFNGKKDVPLDEIWKLLDSHPIFPSEGFKNEIKKELRENYNANIGQTYISFQHRR